MSAAYPLVRNRIAFSTRSGVRTSPSRSGSSPISSSRRRMRSFIYLFYIALFFILCPLALAQNDPDALYRQRATMGRAQQAAAIWEARLQTNPRDFESAWKIARAMYWLGEHDEPNARRKAFQG